jgi:hypothetical protein
LLVESTLSKMPARNDADSKVRNWWHAHSGSFDMDVKVSAAGDALLCRMRANNAHMADRAFTVVFARNGTVSVVGSRIPSNPCIEIVPRHAGECRVVLDDSAVPVSANRTLEVPKWCLMHAMDPGCGDPSDVGSWCALDSATLARVLRAWLLPVALQLNVIDDNGWVVQIYGFNDNEMHMNLGFRITDAERTLLSCDPEHRHQIFSISGENPYHYIHASGVKLELQDDATGYTVLRKAKTCAVVTKGVTRFDGKDLHDFLEHAVMNAFVLASTVSNLRGTFKRDLFKRAGIVDRDNDRCHVCHLDNTFTIKCPDCRQMTLCGHCGSTSPGHAGMCAIHFWNVTVELGL